MAYSEKYSVPEAAENNESNICEDLEMTLLKAQIDCGTCDYYSAYDKVTQAIEERMRRSGHTDGLAYLSERNDFSEVLTLVFDTLRLSLEEIPVDDDALSKNLGKIDEYADTYRDYLLSTGGENIGNLLEFYDQTRLSLKGHNLSENIHKLFACILVTQLPRMHFGS